MFYCELLSVRKRDEERREKETQKEGKGCEKERLRSQQQMVELLQACVDVIFYQTTGEFTTFTLEQNREEK